MSSALKAQARAAHREAFQKSLHTATNVPADRAPADFDWERSVPRCETCKFCRPEKLLLRSPGTKNHPVIRLPPVCKKGNFKTSVVAVCKHWIDRKGATLEK